MSGMVVRKCGNLKGRGQMRDEAHLAPDIVAGGASQPHDMAGLDLDEGLGHSRQGQEQQGLVRVIEPDLGFLLELVDHRKGFDGQGDVPLTAGGDGLIVVGHGAGAIRVHILDI